jgi:hypothetical protein
MMLLPADTKFDQAVGSLAWLRPVLLRTRESGKERLYDYMTMWLQVWA